MTNEEECELELITETASRIEDLSMALCHYNEELAKQALSIAVGNLCARFGEDNFCVHKVIALIEEVSEYICDGDELGETEPEAEVKTEKTDKDMN